MGTARCISSIINHGHDSGYHTITTFAALPIREDSLQALRRLRLGLMTLIDHINHANRYRSTLYKVGFLLVALLMIMELLNLTVISQTSLETSA
jgi:hypothetical protein